MQLAFFLITACNSSCGKVMFSQVSVILSMVEGIIGTRPLLGVSMPGPRPFLGWLQVCPGCGYILGWVCPEKWVCPQEGEYVQGGGYVHRKVGMSREVGMSGGAYCHGVGMSRGMYVHPPATDT